MYLKHTSLGSEGNEQNVCIVKWFYWNDHIAKVRQGRSLTGIPVISVVTMICKKRDNC